eukprot:jgi/Mesvir1/64/Mv18879-RA.1
MKTWVFLDLDQCARDMQAVDGASCHVVAYCGKAYAGPEPLQGEVMRSCALSREAADALFHYDLGRRVRSGAMDRGDRVCVVSRDASWHNAQYHLAADGFTNVIMCTGAKDMPRTSASAPRTRCPRSSRRRASQRARRRCSTSCAITWLPTGGRSSIPG